jgi:hypothetical protein
MEAVDIVGTEPPIAGKVCDALLCQEFWHDGVLEEPANVTFLQFSGEWHRLYFDSGIVFWRDAPNAPETHGEPELKAEYRVVDVGRRYGLVGRELKGVRYRALPEHGSEVTLEFEGGTRLVFRNEHDITGYETVG